MNVLRVIASMNPAQGGPSQGIRNSIPEMEQLGTHNEVLCFDAPNASYLINDSIIIHAIGPAKGPYAYCRGLHSWLLANLNRFDAVIIHGLWLYNGYGTYQAIRRFKKQHNKAPRLFVMPHGMLDPYFQRAPGRKLKAIRNWLFWHLFERQVVNKADGVFFTCEQELLLARETFNRYLPNKERNVGYGIPLPPLHSAKLTHDFQLTCPITFGQSYWLFLSRIHEKKGVDLLIKAYQKLLRDVRALPPLIIAGPGLDTAFGREMMALARSTPQIQFPGMLIGSSKWGALYGCEVFILPSHQENFGIAIVEAMACGKPVLISDKVNIFKEIVTADCGLVAEDNEAGTYQSLKQWYQLSKDQKENKSLNAKRCFEDKFSIEQAAKTLINTIEEAI